MKTHLHVGKFKPSHPWTKQSTKCRWPWSSSLLNWIVCITAWYMLWLVVFCFWFCQIVKSCEFWEISIVSRRVRHIHCCFSEYYCSVRAFSGFKFLIILISAQATWRITCIRLTTYSWKIWIERCLQLKLLLLFGMFWTFYFDFFPCLGLCEVDDSVRKQK